jgi:hypothetical protein
MKFRRSLLVITLYLVAMGMGWGQHSPRINVSWKYVEKDGNNRLDHNEEIKFMLDLKNVGDARANSLKLVINEQNGIQGLEYAKETPLGVLSPNNYKDIAVVIRGGSNLQSGQALFVFQVLDGSGYRADPITISVPCQGLGGGEVYGAVQEVGGQAVAQEMPAYAPPSPPMTEKSTMRGIGDPLKGLNTNPTTAELKFGNYYALIIGVDRYSGIWTPLSNAVNDAKAVESLMRSKYKFDYFRTLYNEQATRASIISEMEWLVANVKEEDNVMIYFSGHGQFKQELNKGYWVPVDAKTNSVSGYISNNDIQTFLGGIRSKHTLLISDACFSGDIFRGSTVSIPFENSDRYFSQVHNLISRQALTSGGIEPVMDGGREGHSVFAYYLLKVLQNNTDRFFDASQLFSQIKIPVINNSEQSPNFQSIKNTGDEGGQFIFVKKQ